MGYRPRPLSLDLPIHHAREHERVRVIREVIQERIGLRVLRENNGASCPVEELLPTFNENRRDVCIHLAYDTKRANAKLSRR